MNTSFAAPFSASKQWIESAFQQAFKLSRPGEEGKCRIGNACTPWVLALLQHDSMDSLKHYYSNVDRLEKLQVCPANSNILERLSRAPSLGAFSNESRSLVQQRLRMRSERIIVRSPNSLSDGFLPPPAGKAVASSAILFRERIGKGDRLNVWRARLASYLIFLTIHPFEDGNGRTARLMFAADTLSNNGPQEDLMALILLHSSASAAFHVSAKCARLGDFCMLFTCFEAARLRAHAMFGENLAILESALDRNDRKEACQVGAKIYADAHGQLKMSCAVFSDPYQSQHAGHNHSC